jgi:hypothetical protein
MGTSRVTGARLLGLVRDFQQLGPNGALQRLNLATLAGRPAPEVFMAILEVVAPPGGAVDEAIARQAMAETIGDMAETEVGSFDSLTPDQMKDFFLDFITRSIEGRVMADIGSRGITIPDDVAAVERMQTQLHDFVTGCTHSALAQRLNGIQNLSDNDIRDTVNQIYELGFELIAAAGEAAA